MPCSGYSALHELKPNFLKKCTKTPIGHTDNDKIRGNKFKVLSEIIVSLNS